MSTVTITGPVLDSLGKPATGLFAVELTSAFEGPDSAYVSRTQYVVQVSNGNPYLEDGSSPWTQIVPPEGQAIRVYERLQPSGDTSAAGTRAIQRTRVLQVPSGVSTVKYGALVEVSPASAEDWTIPAYVQTLLDGLTTVPSAVASAQAAAATAQTAATAAAAVGTTNDAVIAGRINTAGSATDSALKSRFLGLIMAPISPARYGASMDGTGTGDAAAIQLAVNAAQDRGYRGGAVALGNHVLTAPIRISSENITLEGQGGALVGRGLDIRRNTTAGDIYARVSDLTIDMLDPANGNAVALERVGRIQIDRVRIFNAAAGFYVTPLNEHQHLRRLILNQVEVHGCDYGWLSLQPADNALRYTVGDVQINNSQWYNNRVVMRAAGIDGLKVAMFTSFQRQRSDRQRAFDLEYITWSNFNGVNIFEPGEEGLRLSRFQNFHWEGGSIAWAGQKAMRSAILLDGGDLGGNGFSDSSFDGIGLIKPTKHGVEMLSPVDRVDIGSTVRIEQAGSSEFYTGTDDLSSITHYGVVTPTDATQVSVFAVATANRHLLRHGGVSAALNGEGKVQRTPRTLTIDDTRTAIDGTKGYEEVLCAAPTTHTINNMSAGESGQEIIFTGIIGGRTTIQAVSTSGASNKVWVKDGAASVTIPLNGVIKFRYRNSTWIEQTRNWS
ncbi:hypothetical protein [Herbiconiux sp. VKM Ac-2851]|uniref:hypothetical protein n=1 Tax=Herbiconiux sp. VKM Ac-2851 TaxID=2739025 RepID=UPI0015662C83|nr:hypothetical protein [Herbiconiux sp. VKM Ac-2851]NQX35469.1 hypothetical protein [Herbiconiux sp. VKM Ac-2851]